MPAENSKERRIIFFGTSEFAVPILERLAVSPYRPFLVVTSPDKPAGRGGEIRFSPVKTAVVKLGVPVFQPDSLKIENWELKIDAADLFIVAAYGKILPAELLEVPKRGSLNVHPSLLPRWRGPAPVQFAILNGDEETGVTIMLMDEKVDHGPMLKFKNLNIKSKKLTAPILETELAKMGSEILLEVIPDWLSSKIAPVPQDESKATYSRIITKEDGHIIWLRPAVEIERMVRAFQRWPGAYAFWVRGGNRVRLAIEEADLAEVAAHEAPGKVWLSAGGFCVATGRGALRVTKLKLEGRSSMLAEDFIRGHRSIIGVVLE